MFDNFYSGNFDSFCTNRAGFGILGIPFFIIPENHNTMRSAEILAPENSMNFCMEKNLIGQTYTPCARCLIRMSFCIRILADTKRSPFAVIDNSREIKPFFSHPSTPPSSIFLYIHDRNESIAKKIGITGCLLDCQ